MAPRQTGSSPAAAHGQNHVGDYVKPALETAVVKEEDISFLGDHLADKPLLQRLNYLHVFILFGVPALAIYGLFTWEWNSMTAAFSIFYYFVTGLGITAGECRVAVRTLTLSFACVQPYEQWPYDTKLFELLEAALVFIVSIRISFISLQMTEATCTSGFIFRFHRLPSLFCTPRVQGPALVRVGPCMHGIRSC